MAFSKSCRSTSNYQIFAPFLCIVTSYCLRQIPFHVYKTIFPKTRFSKDTFLLKQNKTKLQNVATSNLGNVDVLKLWIGETVQIWNFEILKLSNRLLMVHGSCLKARGATIIPLGPEKNGARAWGTQRQFCLGHEPRPLSHEPLRRRAKISNTEKDRQSQWRL